MHKKFRVKRSISLRLPFRRGLLAASCGSTLISHSRTGTKASDRLYNDVLEVVQEEGVGFNAQQVDTIGKNIISTITDSLWYLDTQHAKLKNRGIQLPQLFQRFQGYNDCEKNHKKPPMLTEAGLKENMDNLAEVLMNPWFANVQFSAFRSNVSDLVAAMQQYRDFLVQQNGRSHAGHKATETVRSFSDQWSYKELEASTGDTPEKYRELEMALSGKSMYSPMSLIDYQPADRI